MAKRFNYVFEDLRRNTTPVRSDGFVDTGASEGDVDVDLNEEDTTKAVRRADRQVTTDDNEGGERGKPNGRDRGDRRQQQAPDSRRDVLAARRAASAAADERISAARAEVTQELTEVRKELAELKGKGELEVAEKEYATKKADIEAQIAEAMEKGNHAEYARLNSSLIELNNDLQRKRLEVKSKNTTAAVEDLNGQRGKAPLVRVKKFLEENAEWWADPDHEDAVSYAKKLDRKLTTELGLDPNSDAYWDAFNRNFDKKFEGLRVKSDDDLDIELDDGGTRGSRVVTPPNKGGGGQPRKQQQQQTRGGEERGGKGEAGKVRLTTADKQNMVAFGLDPSNPEHLLEYAQNKVPETEE